MTNIYNVFKTVQGIKCFINMVKKRKIYRKWWFGLGIVFTLIVIALYSLAELRMNDTTFPLFVDNHGYELEFERYKVGERTMRMVSIGDTNKPLVLAIHGSPSSSAGWENMFNDSILANSVRLIAVDRPGYGFSDFGDLELSLKKQAALIAPILEKYRKRFKTILVVGSSYGGPVAARLSMDYPKLMDGLCLVSAAVAPDEEEIFDISYPTTNPWLRWLVPQAIDNANIEKLGHREELLRMKPFWKNIEAITTIVHGEKDDLIYPENAHFAERNLINAKKVNKIMLPNEAHGIPFTNPDLFRDLIMTALSFTMEHQAFIDGKLRN